MPPSAEDADAPASKKPRFSKDPDLKIVVEDETFEVHSVLLMLVSPVFCQMLTTSMGEHQTGSVQLPGKSKAEFAVLMRFLQPACQEGQEDLNSKNVVFLSKWADEYQIDGLKKKCEDHMMKSMTVNTEALRHALECNLARRAKQCVSAMKTKIAEHLEDLAKLVKELPKEMMAELWPSITVAAGVVMKDMPPVDEVLPMWPFIVAAAQTRSDYAQTKLKLRRLPDDIYMQMSQSSNRAGNHVLAKRVAEKALMDAGIIC